MYARFACIVLFNPLPGLVYFVFCPRVSPGLLIFKPFGLFQTFSITYKPRSKDQLKTSPHPPSAPALTKAQGGIRHQVHLTPPQYKADFGLLCLCCFWVLFFGGFGLAFEFAALGAIEVFVFCGFCLLNAFYGFFCIGNYLFASGFFFGLLFNVFLVLVPVYFGFCSFCSLCSIGLGEVAFPMLLLRPLPGLPMKSGFATSR